MAELLLGKNLRITISATDLNSNALFTIPLEINTISIKYVPTFEDRHPINAETQRTTMITEHYEVTLQGGMADAGVLAIASLAAASRKAKGVPPVFKMSIQGTNSQSKTALNLTLSDGQMRGADLAETGGDKTVGQGADFRFYNLAYT